MSEHARATAHRQFPLRTVHRRSRTYLAGPRPGARAPRAKSTAYWFKQRRERRFSVSTPHAHPNRDPSNLCLTTACPPGKRVNAECGARTRKRGEGDAQLVVAPRLFASRPAKYEPGAPLTRRSQAFFFVLLWRVKATEWGWLHGGGDMATTAAAPPPPPAGPVAITPKTVGIIYPPPDLRSTSRRAGCLLCGCAQRIWCRRTVPVSVGWVSRDRHCGGASRHRGQDRDVRGAQRR